MFFFGNDRFRSFKFRILTQKSFIELKEIKEILTEFTPLIKKMKPFYWISQEMEIYYSRKLSSKIYFFISK